MKSFFNFFAVATLVFSMGCDAGKVSGNDDALCEDGIDNDRDGFVDFGKDPGCKSPSDDNEADDPTPVVADLQPASVPSPDHNKEYWMGAKLTFRGWTNMAQAKFVHDNWDTTVVASKDGIVELKRRVVAYEQLYFEVINPENGTSDRLDFTVQQKDATTFVNTGDNMYYINAAGEIILEGERVSDARRNVAFVDNGSRLSYGLGTHIWTSKLDGSDAVNFSAKYPGLYYYGTMVTAGDVRIMSAIEQGEAYKTLFRVEEDGSFKAIVPSCDGWDTSTVLCNMSSSDMVAISERLIVFMRYWKLAEFPATGKFEQYISLLDIETGQITDIAMYDGSEDLDLLDANEEYVILATRAGITVKPIAGGEEVVCSDCDYATFLPEHPGSVMFKHRIGNKFVIRDLAGKNEDHLVSPEIRDEAREIRGIPFLPTGQIVYSYASVRHG